MNKGIMVIILYVHVMQALELVCGLVVALRKLDNCPRIKLEIGDKFFLGFVVCNEVHFMWKLNGQE